MEDSWVQLQYLHVINDYKTQVSLMFASLVYIVDLFLEFVFLLLRINTFYLLFLKSRLYCYSLNF